MIWADPAISRMTAANIVKPIAQPLFRCMAYPPPRSSLNPSPGISFQTRIITRPAPTIQCADRQRPSMQGDFESEQDEAPGQQDRGDPERPPPPGPRHPGLQDGEPGKGREA